MQTLTKERNKETSMDKIDSSQLSSAELAQRVAVLKRFKTLLGQQRDRFRNYLDLLDKQQNVIESGSAEDLLTYVEIEEKIVADIFSIQKVIDPLEEMYYSAVSGNAGGDAPGEAMSNDVPDLKASLERLKSEAVIRSTKNKELLSKRMIELRSEIKALRDNPYTAKTRSSGFGGINSGNLIDISG